MGFERRSERGSSWATGLLGALGLYFIADNIADRFLGCLIGCIFVPLFVAGIGGFIWYSKWDDRKDAEIRSAAETDEVLQRAANRIQAEGRRLGRLPFDDEGNALFTSFQDGWRTRVIYERIDDQSFQIRSSGSDRKRDTDDDVTLKKRVTTAELQPEPKSTPEVAP